MSPFREIEVGVPVHTVSGQNARRCTAQSMQRHRANPLGSCRSHRWWLFGSAEGAADRPAHSIPRRGALPDAWFAGAHLDKWEQI